MTIGGAWDPAVTLNTYVTAGDTPPRCFLGLFPSHGYPQGRTRLLHAPTRFPAAIGVPSPHDGRTYAFVDDVAGGQANTVLFATQAFGLVNPAITVPDNVDAMFNWFAANAGEQLMTCVASGTANTVDSPVSAFCWVHPAIIPQLLGQRLTPLELLTNVIQPMDAATRTACAPLVNWAMAAAHRRTNADVASPLCIARDVENPIGSPRWLEWRQEVLKNMLPGLVNPVGLTAAATNITAMMGDLVAEARNTRADAVNARLRAAAPKTVGEHFKPYLTARLLELTSSATEAQLPQVWGAIAEAGGKRERETLDANLREVAQGLDFNHLVPVVTPDLLKKITSLRLAGSNMDNLAEGISPFVLIVADYTSPSSEQAYLDAVRTAQDFDDLIAGNTAANMEDIKTLKSATKVQVPTTYVSARAQLQAFLILIATLLGDRHACTIQLQNWLKNYTNKENFYISRVQREDGAQGPARLLRYIQLNFRAWFMASESATTPAARALIPPLEIASSLNKTEIGDMTWLPLMPFSYHYSQKKVTTPGTEKEDDESNKKKSSQVRNPTVNTRFDDFKSGITQSKFNDLIKKVGAPPTVQRGGKTIPMCASYHLRGTCFSNCSRKADHGSHSKEEDNELYEWCKKAFE